MHTSSHQGVKFQHAELEFYLSLGGQSKYEPKSIDHSRILRKSSFIQN